MAGKKNNRNLRCDQCNNCSLNCSFREVFENTSDLCYRRNLVTDIYDFLTPAVTRLTGYTVEEFLGLAVSQIESMIHPEDIAALRQHYVSWLAMANDKKTSLEYRFRHKEGHYRWFSDHLNVSRDANGNPVAVVGVVRDITEHKALVEQLRQLEQKHKILYNNAKVGLYRAAANGNKLLECNEYTYVMLGYDNHQQCLDEFIPVKAFVDTTVAKWCADQLEESGEINVLELQLRMRSGAAKWVRFSAKLYAEMGYIDGVMIDITVKKLLSPAELRVLKLLTSGLCNKEIARRISRSTRTVEDHRAHIMEKLQVSSPFELARLAALSEL